VADRDGRDHDHAAAVHHRHQAGLRDAPLPGVFADVLDESTGEPIEEGQGLLVLNQSLAVDAAKPCTGSLKRVRGHVLQSLREQTYLVLCTQRVATRRLLWVIGRIDDVVNVSGHRLSTAEVESAIVAHPDVAEAAVIGQHDEDSGRRSFRS